MKPMLGCLFALMAGLILPQAWAQGALQTQMGLTGTVEVDVVKAGVREGILTVVLSYRNAGQEPIKVGFNVDELYFIDETEKKKYHVLKDSKGESIGAPTSYNKVGYTTPGGPEPVKVPPGGKQTLWFKFPAPPESVQTIELLVPDVLPFEKLPISR
jgi:hypothetical protein